MAKDIKLIMGSIREERVGSDIADWVKQRAGDLEMLEIEILDLKRFDIPFLDEPLPPAASPSEKPEVREWSSRIENADGFIFLTPEYNAGYPGVLKNAIDYLYHEWQNKPGVIISYGKADGGRTANAHLHDVLDRIGVNLVETSPKLHLTSDILDDGGNITDPGSGLAPYAEDVRTALQELSDTLS